MAGLHSSGFWSLYNMAGLHSSIYEVCTIWLDYTVADLWSLYNMAGLHSSGFMKFVQYGWITQ